MNILVTQSSSTLDDDRHVNALLDLVDSATDYGQAVARKDFKRAEVASRSMSRAFYAALTLDR